MTNFDTLINKPRFLNIFTILSFLMAMKNKKTGGIYFDPFICKLSGQAFRLSGRADNYVGKGLMRPIL
jgi:hypothetical protein